MNKLDEILKNFVYEKLLAGVNDYGDWCVKQDTNIDKLIKEAKQAIIELIEGEIIGENEEKPVKYVEDNMDLAVRTSCNWIKEEQRQKLQKLKE